MKLKLIFLVSFFVIIHKIQAQSIVFKKGDQAIDISNQLYFWTDTSKQAPLHDVIRSNEFQKTTKQTLFFETSDNIHWVKFKLNNQTDRVLKLLIDSPDLNLVHLFALNANDSLLYEKIEGGDIPYSKKEFNHPSIIFNLENLDSITTYFLCVSANEPINIPIQILNEKSLQSFISLKDTLYGIYLGFSIVLFIYILIIHRSIRNRVYLWYLVYILLVTLSQLFTQGYLAKYLWPEHIWLNDYQIYILPTLSGIAFQFFVLEFIQVKKYSHNIYYSLFFFTCLYFIGSTLGILGINYSLGQNLINISALLISSYSLIIAFFIFFEIKYKPALYFIFASIFFISGVIIYVLTKNGAISTSIISIYMMPLGSAIEMLLIAFAMSDNINTIRKEKEKSQKEALELAIENERIIEEQKEALEEKVNLRTQELNEANLELERQALSAQMDPHFIFNSLNSIQNFILKNDKFEAQKYLSKFSKLMRFYLNSSRNELVDLVDEINAIHTYLELERLRFQNKFSFSIKVDPKIDQLHTQIPSMLIIPFLENAVWHGVIKRNDTEGKISITLSATNDAILCHIEDNGVGYHNSQKSSRLIKNHKSAGIEITKNRLKVLHKSLNSSLDLTINELSEQQHYAGTLVQFTIPCL